MVFLVGCKDLEKLVPRNPGELVPHTNQDISKIRMGETFDQVTDRCGFPDKYYATDAYQVLVYRIEGEVPYDIQFPNAKNILKGIDENLFYDSEEKKLVTPEASIEIKYTPVLLKNDKVVGMGWRSLEANGIGISEIKATLQNMQ